MNKSYKLSDKAVAIVVYFLVLFVALTLQEEKSEGLNETLDELIEQADGVANKTVPKEKSGKKNDSSILYLNNSTKPDNRRRGGDKNDEDGKKSPSSVEKTETTKLPGSTDFTETTNPVERDAQEEKTEPTEKSRPSDKDKSSDKKSGDKANPTDHRISDKEKLSAKRNGDQKASEQEITETHTKDDFTIEIIPIDDIEPEEEQEVSRKMANQDSAAIRSSAAAAAAMTQEALNGIMEGTADLPFYLETKDEEFPAIHDNTEQVLELMNEVTSASMNVEPIIDVPKAALAMEATQRAEIEKDEINPELLTIIKEILLLFLNEKLKANNERKDLISNNENTKASDWDLLDQYNGWSYKNGQPKASDSRSGRMESKHGQSRNAAPPLYSQTNVRQRPSFSASYSNVMPVPRHRSSFRSSRLPRPHLDTMPFPNTPIVAPTRTLLSNPLPNTMQNYWPSLLGDDKLRAPNYLSNIIGKMIPRFSYQPLYNSYVYY